MARGGKRPGAGRKAGVPSRKTINRLKIAEDAAPYLHPRLSAVDTTLKDDGGLVVQIVKFAQPVEDQLAAEPLAVTH